ncbi:MAG: magnesium transporter [Chloroflexota bacterium]|jgi:magnesium transporter|nr:magnesium transporter [Chloroflexota bacterium]MEA2653424.1 magnesium transporter [Chloroflexota bacterium]
MASKLKERQLLWVDLADRDRAALDEVAAAVDLDPAEAGRLAHEATEVRLTQFPEHIHLVLEALEAPDAGAAAAPNAKPDRRFVDVVAGHNWVVTIHDGPFEAVARLDAGTEGETKLGALDASGFIAAIADEVIAGYFQLIEGIEREIDQLDELALQRRPKDDLLVAIVALRRRIGRIRRALAPHRGPFAAMARPEMALHEELGQPWPGLSERLERALDSVENLRELLLGTFDIHMGRAAQDANDVMKVLTLLSAILLPSVVLAGVMGMNFPIPFFDDPNHFLWVVSAMVAFAVGMFAFARWRRWL